MNLNMNLNSKFTLLSCCEVEFPIQLKPIPMNLIQNHEYCIQLNFITEVEYE